MVEAETQMMARLSLTLKNTLRGPGLGLGIALSLLLMLRAPARADEDFESIAPESPEVTAVTEEEP